ncbi:hypothetical protein [Corallococcus exiguus]|uniref:hypothetical protein n=1 Tax=Corallococcus exiguus TaxID=83462 RepID=UPI0014949B55|nr:hypothetical protein [Corallococcus exiguus]NPD26565.1 hypothetical protein [Corallococcus exiguus]
MQRVPLLLALASLIPTGALAAPHVTKLLPQDAGVHCSPATPCTQPTADGMVSALEYADGKKFPLQDYVNGGPNGDLFLSVSDNASYTADECNVGKPQNPCHVQSLFIGMRLPKPRNASGNFVGLEGTVSVWFDAKRGETLQLASGAHVPRDEDRRITLSYSTVKGYADTVQSKGNLGGTNGWGALAAPTEAWDTTVVVASPASDPAHVHIEFEIKLAPGLPVGGASEPLLATVRKLGLGIEHIPVPTTSAQTVGGGRFPNRAGLSSGGTLTGNWETLEFTNPTPIPLSFTMWNVGQMPDVTAWVDDGGSGEIDTVAQRIFRKEVACISEIWMAHERGELIEKVNALRAGALLPPMQAVTELNDNILQPSLFSTGLVLLSSRQILEGGVHHFPFGMCTDEDCAQAKGVLWARIATPAATAPVFVDEHDTPTLAAGTDYAEFVDVFCTHVNAGENTAGPDTTARENQFSNIKAYVQQVRQGGPLTDPVFGFDVHDAFPQGTWPSGLDRPAFLLGDLNTVGPKGVQTNVAFNQYADMVGPGLLDISTLSEFDKANTQFSEMRDLARVVSGPNPMAGGTWLSSVCTDNVVNELDAKKRLDYVLVFPAQDTLDFPAFALLNGTTASVNPHFDPTSGSEDSEGNLVQQCLSDHAMVDVTVQLARVKDVVKYNPMKKHRVEYAVKQVTDLETASGCCADWFSPRVLMTANGFTKLNTFLNIIEDQTIYPNWRVHTGADSLLPDLPVGFSGAVNMTSAIWESDSGPNDHYDSTPESSAILEADDKDAHLTFFANSGVLRRVKGELTAIDWLAGVELLGSFMDGYESGITVETEGHDTATGNNARVRHYFNVKEMESP